MSNFLTGPVQVAAQGVHVSSADQMHKLGEIVFANDGRAFRYTEAGATALVAGTVQQSQAQDTDTQNLTAVAAAINDTAIAATTTVTVTANEYAEGFVVVSVTPGVGKTYKISGHIAYTAAAPTFNLHDYVDVALTTTSRIDAFANPYKDVVQAATTFTAPAVGVAVDATAIDQFGWLQVLGLCNVLLDGIGVIGEPVIRSNGTAGSVEPVTTTFTVQGNVGWVYTAVSSTEYGGVILHLP